MKRIFLTVAFTAILFISGCVKQTVNSINYVEGKIASIKQDGGRLLVEFSDGRTYIFLGSSPNPIEKDLEYVVLYGADSKIIKVIIKK